MTGTATILRGNALDLPLADASVDLIVTSPPSDSDAIELLGALETSLESVREIRSPAGTVRSIAPDRNERLGDVDPTPDALRGDVPDAGGLIRDGSTSPGKLGGLEQGQQWLIGTDLGNDVLAPCWLGVDAANGDRVLGLGPLDPQIGQERLTHRAGLARVNRPRKQGATPLHIGLSDIAVATEKPLQQVYGLGRDLLDLNASHVDRLARITPDTHRVVAPVNADVPIRVNYSGSVSEVRL